MKRLQKAIWLSIFTLASAAFGQESDFHIEGRLRYGGIQATGPASWLTGQSGRLYTGDADDLVGFGHGDLAFEYAPSLFFKAYVHVLGRLEPDEIRGESWGVPEAYLQSQFGRGTHEMTFKMGWFFPPTSMENSDPLWTSPYTLSLSAINAWVAEELRFTGLDVRYSSAVGESTFYAEATLLAGNDSLGALVAWRGWTLGQRLSVWGEDLPLPPLSSLESGGAFAIQSQSGTQPLTWDHDGHLGLSARLAFEWPQGLLSLHHLDNQGDRGFYNGDYSWETRFSQIGFTWFPNEWFTLLGEYLRGETGMGPEDQPHVQTDFDAWYLLPSATIGPLRFSLRYDDFGVADVDRLRVATNADSNDEWGSAWTAALFYQFTPSWRLGLEWLSLDATRPQPENLSLPGNLDGRSWTLEASVSF